MPLFPDLDEALAAGGYDAVVLVTPPDGHLSQARAIFAAGLPLMAEKPLTVALGDAVTIVRMAEDAGLALSVCLNFRYLPVSQKKRELVRSQACGAPGMGQFVYQRNRDGLRPGLNRYPLVMDDPMSSNRAFIISTSSGTATTARWTRSPAAPGIHRGACMRTTARCSACCPWKVDWKSIISVPGHPVGTSRISSGAPIARME